MYTVDVIIPTYKPKKELLEVLQRLNRQTIVPNRIILMNTEEAYFDQLIYGAYFIKYYENCKVYHLSKLEFDHGATRNAGVYHSGADYFIMMTQDALPKDEYLIERLIEPLLSHKAAVSYARQLPREDCNPIERYTRGFNYPDRSFVKHEEDVGTLGIKTYFCSDVCAAYDRAVFDKVKGFVKRAIFNEDMLYAAKIAKEGYGIAYCADACVYHSHNYTAKQQFHRNFDLGVSQADHPEIFEGVPSEGEGLRLVKKSLAYLIKTGHIWLVPKLVGQSGFKYMGYFLGKRYKKLPKKVILFCTMNREYWKNE